MGEVPLYGVAVSYRRGNPVAQGVIRVQFTPQVLHQGGKTWGQGTLAVDITGDFDLETQGGIHLETVLQN